MKHTISSVFGVTEQGVRVEHKKRRSAAGDKIRQGRVESPPLVPSLIALTYIEREDGCIYVLLAKAEVGVICTQKADVGQRPGFNWLCFLPEQRRAPRYAADLDKAKDAIRVTVEGWCEAAGLAAKARRHPHAFPGKPLGWREGEAG